MAATRVGVVVGAGAEGAVWVRVRRRAAAACIAAATFAGGSEAFAQLYWNTNGTSATLTATNWGTSPTGPFTTVWSSGTTIAFSANSAITGATTTVRGITVAASTTVTWTGGGTLNTGSTIAIVDVGVGGALNMTAQTISSATTGNSTGFNKTGAGTWNLTNTAGGGAMALGITLNAGRIVTTSGNNLGNGPLTINGGIWEATGNNTYNATSVTIGGNFGLEGSGNNAFAAATAGISLGNATRTITNNAGGSGVYRTLLGVISGSSGVGLTFSGTGNSYLGNAGNTFDGPLTVTGGELLFNAGGLGAGTSIVLDGGRITSGSVATGGSPGPNALTSASIASSKTISVSGVAGNAIGVQGGSGVLTFDGVIADKAGSTGSWTKAGSGRLTLGGASTYSGSTAIANGTLQLASGSNRLPVTTVVSLGQAVSTNLGTLDLNGNNQQIAGLASVAGSNAGASTNTVTSVGAATLTINVASGTFTYSAGSAADSGVISGAISLVKNGNGTQVLGGANSYTGSTTVNAGLLRVNGSQTGNGAVTVGGGELNVNGSLGTSAVTLNAGILSGTGSVGAVTVNAGATLSPGNSPGTLTTGAVTFNGGGSYNWQLFNSTGSEGTGWDSINSSGGLTVNATSGSPFNFNLWTLSSTNPDTNGNAQNFNPAVNRTWRVGTFASGISSTAAGWYSINTTATNGTGGFTNPFTGTFSLTTTGNDLNLVYTAPVLTSYDYTAGTGNWSTGANWSGGTAPSGDGLAISFSGTGGTSTNDSQVASVSGLTFTGSASGSYVVAGSPLSIGGPGITNSSSSAQTVQNVLTATAATVVNAVAGSLTLAGTFDNGGYGLTLEGANAISMATISGTGALSKIEGGTATLNGAVATNSVSVAAGTLQLGSSDLLSNSAAVTLSGSGSLNLGGFSDTVGTLATSGNATVANGTLTAGTYALDGGTVSGNLGGGTLTNTGATALNGTAGAGTVNLNAGVLTLGSAGRLTGAPGVTGSAGASLVLGGNETVASLAGGAAVTLGSATLTVGSDNATTTYSGAITGAGGVTKNGTGTLTFSGSAGYTGPTVVNAGAVGIANAATRTFSSSVSGSGGFVKSGAGTLTLSGNNTYSGGTTITDGIVSVAAASNLATSGSIAISGDGALRFNGSDTFGGVGQQLVLSATQAANPIINLASGNTTTFLGDVVFASGTNRFEPSGAATTLTLAGNLSGAGVLNKAAQGTLVLSGSNNTLAGGFLLGNGKVTVNAGSGLGSGPVVLNPTSNGATGNVTLELNESVSIGSLSTSTSGGGSGGRFITIASSKTLGVNQTSNATFSGDISGAGGFTKTGAASLTFTGSNSFTGPTTVSDGSITYSGANTFTRTGTVTVTNGGGIVLDSNGTYGAIGQALVLSATQSASPVLSMASNATPTFQGDVNLASGVNRIEANGVSGTLTFTGNLTGAGTLLKAASGELVLAGAANTATGATQIGNGKITVNAGSALGTGDLTFAQTSTNDTRVDLKNAIQSIGSLATVWSATAQAVATTITQRLDLANGVALTINQTGTTTFGNYAGAPANVTGLGVITGDGSITKSGAGLLTLSGSNSYSGGTTLVAGVLVAGNVSAFGTGLVSVDGGTLDLGSFAVTNGITVSAGSLANAEAFAGATTITGIVSLGNAANSAVTIDAGGVLQGAATVASLAGAGLVSPGNSPGILTAGSFDGSGGLDAAFEITGLAPAYGVPSASVNDVLRLTGGTPFAGFNLGGGNTIDVYFASSALSGGTYDAGFFATLGAEDLLSAVQSANWVYWGQDALGAHSFNGINYAPLLSFTDITGVTVGTVARTVNFGGGEVSGSVTQFIVTAVPEPTTEMLVFIGGASVLAFTRRRRRGDAGRDPVAG
jgi:autotransporter-associated beta strand protein